TSSCTSQACGSKQQPPTAADLASSTLRATSSRSMTTRAVSRRKESRPTLPKVLVTGGAGFIGSHVADFFLDKGFEVVIVDDLSTGKRENLSARARFHEIGVNSPEFVRLVR